MNEPTLVRRLTTIVSIDVVGFSTMSARNEEHALELLGARMATAETIVKHHRGRVFKLTGDGMLAEFVSPVEAVRASLEILESIAPHGGVCVSASIYEQIIGKLTLSAEDMGEQHVKNIPRPIHAYRLR